MRLSLFPKIKPPDTPDIKLGGKVLAAKEARDSTRNLAASLAANDSLEWQDLPMENLIKSGQLSQSKKVAGKRFGIFSRKIDVQSFSLAGTPTKLDISPSLGAGLLRLELDGREIISSPALSKKLSGRTVADLEGMQFISPPNRTRKGDIYFYDTKKNLKKVNLNKDKDAEFNQGNLIHGVVGKKKWALQKIESNTNGDLRITYSFNTANDKKLAKILGEAEYKTIYTLSKNKETNIASLSTHVSVTNKGSKKSANEGIFPLVGVGFHPYFNISNNATFKAPVQEGLELDSESIPTGKLINGDRERTIREGRPASQQAGLIDNTFIVNSSETTASSTITDFDKRGNYEIKIKQNSKQYPYLTVFNGTPIIDGKQRLCIEPITCAPNAGSKAALEGDFQANSKILQLGESLSANFSISLEESKDN